MTLLLTIAALILVAVGGQAPLIGFIGAYVFATNGMTAFAFGAFMYALLGLVNQLTAE